MTQALHILKKDARYLSPEITFLVALSTAFVFLRPQTVGGPSWIEILIMLASSYLVARAVHAEAIPGENQFWLTRPYRWMSLLLAKVGFILLFVGLPVLIARTVILVIDGFPVIPSLPGLIWSQGLLIFALWLPVAALAAVTSRITHLILSCFVVTAIAWVVGSFGIARGDTWPFGVQWIRFSIVLVVSACSAAFVLYMQYKNRRTIFSRMFAIVAVCFGVVGYSFVPATMGMALQSRLSKESFDSASLQIRVDPVQLRVYSGVWTRVSLPITITGVPENIDLQGDAANVTLLTPAGTAWHSGLLIMNKRSGAANVFDAMVYTESSFFLQARTQPLTVRGSLYLTLFGQPESKTIPLQRNPVNVLDGLQCYLDDSDQTFCRQMLRYPRKLLYLSGRDLTSALSGIASYSPYPGELSINPVVYMGYASVILPGQEVTVIAKEPLAHIRRDFEIQNFRLDDFAPDSPLH